MTKVVFGQCAEINHDATKDGEGCHDFMRPILRYRFRGRDGKYYHGTSDHLGDLIEEVQSGPNNYALTINDDPNAFHWGEKSHIETALPVVLAHCDESKRSTAPVLDESSPHPSRTGYAAKFTDVSGKKYEGFIAGSEGPVPTHVYGLVLDREGHILSADLA